MKIKKYSFSTPEKQLIRNYIELEKFKGKDSAMIASLDVPVFRRSEIVIAGAGPAGVAAALAAASLGCKVTLLEQSNAAGGLGTLGLVPAVIYQTDGVDYVAGKFCREIVAECCREMGVKKISLMWQEVDPEIMKRIYDRRLEEAGVEILYMTRIADAIVSGGRIEALLAATPRGLEKVEGVCFIDATGDACLAAFCGAPCEVGDEEGRTMSPTLCPQFSNIDLAAYLASRAGGRRDRTIWNELLAKGEAPLPEHHFVGVCTYGNGTASGNLGHLYGVNALDPAQLTRACIEGRKLAKIYHDFYVRHVPGFEKSDLVNTAALPGVRETRRIVGDYRLNFEDYTRRAVFEDEIGRFSYPVDIHSSSTDPEEQKRVERVMRETCCKPGESYGIPCRALLPQGVENLYVAGRCISADRPVQSSLRVIPGCFITGQAAGAGAALSLGENGVTRRVDTAHLRRILSGEFDVPLR